MARGQKNEAFQRIRQHYESDWSFRLTATGVELWREVSLDALHHLFFTCVRDDSLGLRLQPAVGVTFAQVNKIRSALTEVHEGNAAPVTGYVFLNDLLSRTERHNAGWFFSSGSDLSGRLDELLILVDKTVAATSFLETLLTLQDYVVAVDQARWRFFTVMPTFLYALVAVGDTSRALALAAHHRDEVVKAAKEKGYVLRESDTHPYEQVISYLKAHTH
jgi:hypothetical protein